MPDSSKLDSALGLAFQLAMAVTGLVLGILLWFGLEGGGLHRSVWVHLGIAAVLVCGWAFTDRLPTIWRNRIRILIAVGVFGGLYKSLTPVIHEVMPWNSDALLAAGDERLLRDGPYRFADWANTGFGIALFSAIYLFYLPYIHVCGVHHALLNRDPERQRQTVLGFSLVYAFGFLGYLFLPAYGPILFCPEAYGAPIHNGWMSRLVARVVEAGGGAHGAFPSLHVATSLFFLGLDYRFARRRFWVCLLPVGLIPLATVVVRYHYVVDLLAGIALAGLVLLVVRRRGRHSG